MEHHHTYNCYCTYLVLEPKVKGWLLEMSLTSQTYRHHFRQLVSYHFPEHYINALRLVIGGEMEGGEEGREGREGGREGRKGGESRGVEGEDRNKLEQEK